MADPLLAINVAAIFSIHYIWRAYQAWESHRRRTLRDRVSFLLWAVAEHAA